MKTIRNSVFETNSSSMHSITMQNITDNASDDICEHIYTNDKTNEKIMLIKMGVFDQDPELLRTPYKKLQYILAVLRCKDSFTHSGYDISDLQNCFNNGFNDLYIKHDDESFYSDLLECLTNILNKRYPNVEFVLSDDSYIDDESENVLFKYCNYTCKTLRAFEYLGQCIEDIIYNPKIIIVIDSRNYPSFTHDTYSSKDMNRYYSNRFYEKLGID